MKYLLPDGRVVEINDDAARGQHHVSFELANTTQQPQRQIVQATRMYRDSEDVRVLHDAARQLEVAARALRQIATTTPGFKAGPLVTKARVNISAALARIPERHTLD